MVNPNASPVGARKEDYEEYARHIDELIKNADVLEIARHVGLNINEDGRIACPGKHDGDSTLRIDALTGSFRCSAPGCNEHGDIVTFTQRFTGVPFQEALKILAHGNGTSKWIEENAYSLKTMGLVRDCMSAATRFYAGSVDQVSHYLARRGVSDQTAQKFMLGAAVGKDALKQALIEKGFDGETIQLTGLLNSYGHDRFQNHVVVPIFRHGQVVDFYGRLLTDDLAQGKHWRLSSERMILGYTLFNWNPEQEEIILVEGIFDALSLAEHGFHNAVAVGGTNGIAPELITESSAKRVFMCFDGDGPGQKQGLTKAYALIDVGLEVRIIDLPDDQDPNEFLMSHAAEDFDKLLSKAAHPEIWEVDHLDVELDEHEKLHTMENVIHRAAAMEPIPCALLCKRMAKKLGLKEKDVREHIEGVINEEARSATRRSATAMDLSTYELVHPALHLGQHGTLMTIPLMETNPKTGKRQWEPWAVNSERELFPLTHEELNRRGYYCHDILCPGRQRYSQPTITEFLEGTRHGDLAGTYNLIKRVYQGYLDFSDPKTFDYLTAWAIGTYFFPLFNYYPYLHFTGTKEVGKSKAMKLMSQLCFNGIMSVSITDASQFRIITELLPTLFLDETENLSDRTYSERRSLLLGGYEKGSTAIRTEKMGDTFRTREFDNFSPRVFGSIEGLEDTLASRTIQIAMKRSYNEKIKEAEVELTNSIFQNLRDQLFLVAMDSGQTIKDIYEHMDRPGEAGFDAREWNLFKPIMAIGEATGEAEITQALIGFANQSYNSKTEALNNTAVENVILRCLSELVCTEDWYELDLIHRYALDFIKQQGLNVGMLSKDRLGKLIHDLDLINNKDRRVVQGRKITCT